VGDLILKHLMCEILMRGFHNLSANVKMIKKTLEDQVVESLEIKFFEPFLNNYVDYVNLLNHDNFSII
jgi:hypothetical protein